MILCVQLILWFPWVLRVLWVQGVEWVLHLHPQQVEVVLPRRVPVQVQVVVLVPVLEGELPPPSSPPCPSWTSSSSFSLC